MIIIEEWSPSERKKRKKNCSNPKGFTMKQFCKNQKTRSKKGEKTNEANKMDKNFLLQIIKEEIEKLLSEEKKHAMYDPKTGKKVMADGEKHKELAKKDYVHFDPKKVIAATDKEGGAAGLDAIIKHTGADEKELKKNISKVKGIVKHKKGDYITVKTGRQVAEEIIRQEIQAVLDEKRKKRKKKKKKKKKGKKDACYYKVRARYSVWPSAYASGALVKCRKVGAKNWGNKSKKK